MPSACRTVTHGRRSAGSNMLRAASRLGLPWVGHGGSTGGPAKRQRRKTRLRRCGTPKAAASSTERVTAYPMARRRSSMERR